MVYKASGAARPRWPRRWPRPFDGKDEDESEAEADAEEEEEEEEEEVLDLVDDDKE